MTQQRKLSGVAIGGAGHFCCVCRQEFPTTSLCLAREIGNYEYQEIPMLSMPDIEPVRTLRYRFHNGPCELQFSHAAGFHLKMPHDLCETCIITMARAELRNLSTEAKAVLYDAVRNRYCALSIGLELQIRQPDFIGDRSALRELVESIHRANREFTELLEGE